MFRSLTLFYFNSLSIFLFTSCFFYCFLPLSLHQTKTMCWKRVCFLLFFMCRRIGEYISLELFYTDRLIADTQIHKRNWPAAGVSRTRQLLGRAPGCWPCPTGPCAHVRCDGLSPPASWVLSVHWSVGRRCHACLRDRASCGQRVHQSVTYFTVVDSVFVKVLHTSQNRGLSEHWSVSRCQHQGQFGDSQKLHCPYHNFRTLQGTSGHKGKGTTDCEALLDTRVKALLILRHFWT